MKPPVCLAAPEYWHCYNALPEPIRRQANRSFELMKTDPHHPLLHFKQIDRYWTARIDAHYRAIAVQIPEGLLWFWIGTHTEYDQLVA